ncbi:MAG: hypothetical protein R2712_18615 [Vicinamibacterales bacterium]
MDEHDGGELTGREAGEQAHDTQDEALRAGDAGAGAHALGGGLDAVNDRPEQLHELEHVGVVAGANRVGEGQDLRLSHVGLSSNHGMVT